MKYDVSNRNVGIDLLRGMSIIYIVGFWHMLNYTQAIPYYKNMISSRITVIVLATFVFISGYFIGKSDLEINKPKLLSFYMKRFFRIYPLYLLSIIFFMYFGLSDFKTSIKALLLISMFVKPAPPTLWFVTMLMTFYALSPIFMIACKNLKVLHLIYAYLLLSFFLMVYWFFTRMLDVRIIIYLPSFIFGFFIAVNRKITINVKYLYLALIAGALISFLAETPSKTANSLLVTLKATLAAYFLFKLFSQINLNNQKINRIIILLSYSSYCMYLFHRPIYHFLKKIYFPDSNHSQLIYLIIFCLPCIGFFSYIMQRIYDNAIQELKSKLI
jgi:peptidoglycan/LPS O-acetylase OafA/YrhL